MSKRGSAFTDQTPPGLTDGPTTVHAGSHERLRELYSLGLTHEASLGILRVLMRSGARAAAGDPAEW